MAAPQEPDAAPARFAEELGDGARATLLWWLGGEFTQPTNTTRSIV